MHAWALPFPLHASTCSHLQTNSANDFCIPNTQVIQNLCAANCCHIQQLKSFDLHASCTVPVHLCKCECKALLVQLFRSWHHCICFAATINSFVDQSNINAVQSVFVLFRIVLHMLLCNLNCSIKCSKVQAAAHCS